jgi:hypothetical protein
VKIDRPIVIACKEAPERLPPVLTLVSILSELANDVILVTNKIGDDTRENMEEQGVRVVEGWRGLDSIMGPQTTLSKAIARRAFRHAFWKTCGPLKDEAILWIATGDSAWSIGHRLLLRRYILGLLELYDRQKWALRLLRPYIRRADCVVVPEPCRAAIFRVWYELPYTPIVLPNKPYGLTHTLNMPVIQEEARRELDRIRGRKLLLYQARSVRMEMFEVAEAISRYLGDEYVLGILGGIHDHAMFAKLKAQYPRPAYFGYAVAPGHLAVTSHAHMGVLVYNYESLNNIFCAPNKTWEYASFGLPMICNELPMLSEQFERYQAGETFQMGNAESVAEAVRTIDANYSAYCEGAARLFATVDTKQIISDVLQEHLARGVRNQPWTPRAPDTPELGIHRAG